MRATSLPGPLLGAFFALAADPAAAAETAPPHELIFSCSQSALEIVCDDDAFQAFALRLGLETDRLLLAKSGVTSDQEKRLLGLRVHLALCLGQDDVAYQMADRLRELQTDPGERAHSGLLTRAMIESKRDTVALERRLYAALDALPRDPSTKTAVERSAARLAALSEPSLIAEIRDVVAPKLARGEPCTVELADQIIRAGHRLRNVLPVRAAILRAYAAALANWR
jgi:hypothetical protein